MIDIISVYNDLVNDGVTTAQRGRLSIASFNRMSRRAELRLINYLSGDVDGEVPPAPWMTQKNKDWLSPFLIPKTGVAQN